MYASDLEHFRIQDVECALNLIASRPMGQFDKPMPPIASIIAEVDAERKKHITAAALRIWHCLNDRCKATQASAEVAVCHKCGGASMKEQKPLQVVEFDNPDRMKHPEKYFRIAEAIHEFQKEFHANH